MKTKEQLEKKVNILDNVLGWMIVFLFLFMFVVLGAMGDKNYINLVVGSFLSYAAVCFIMAFITDKAKGQLIEMEEEPTKESKKINEFNVFVYTKKNEVYITLASEEGPVIVGANYADAERKFLEAMPLTQRLLYFKEHGKFPE